MELNNGQYYIGNLPIQHFVETYDSPVYIYDAQRIISQYRKLYDAFDVDNLVINYACKALTNINILQLFNSLGSGLDTVSYQETQIGLRAGFPPERIIFTPNMVSSEEIEAAFKLGVKINIDNIEMLEYFGHHHPNMPICIRVNPHIMAGGNSKISVGHIDSKFGISIHQMPLVERIIKALNIKIVGLHMHSGSDILDTDVFLKAADILFNVASHFKDLEYLDFGSGFKVGYKPGDIETDIVEFGEKMSAKFNSFCKQIDKPLTLMFEPGKFLVSESGTFLVTTNVVKQTTSNVFAGVNSGFNHLIRPMMYDAHHEIINVSNPEGKPKIYTVVGYICETDTFGANRVINEIRPGDYLAIKNAGAYCFEMSSNYNSRFRPAEVLVYNGKDYLIRKRDKIDTLLNNQVDQEIFTKNTIEIK